MLIQLAKLLLDGRPRWPDLRADNPNTTPELGTLERSRRVDLYGTVSKVDHSLGVTLQLDRFELLPATLWDRIVSFFNRGPS